MNIPEEDLVSSPELQRRPPAHSGDKNDKRRMKYVCEKCFTGKQINIIFISLNNHTNHSFIFCLHPTESYPPPSLTIAASLTLLPSRNLRHKFDHTILVKGSSNDTFPGEPWLRCGVSGCLKLNVHAICHNIKLASGDDKSVKNFCNTFVRCGT